jgi:outer membrane protein assembly factor BamB
MSKLWLPVAAQLLCVAFLAELVLAQQSSLPTETGVDGGLVVHVGCGDVQATASLRRSHRFVVEGLDTDASNVAKARRHFDSLGLSGQLTAVQFDGKRLPYAENLVNLLVIEDKAGLSDEEIHRVLAPGGAAWDRADGRWTKNVKPWPSEIDEWSHYLHDATGNAVAHDARVSAPKSMRWIAGPIWSRSHEYDASLCAMVSSGGRLFYILDEGPTGVIDKRIPDKWALIARDAFNGVPLWKKPIADWGWKAWKEKELKEADWSRMRSQRFKLPASIPRRLVAAGDRVYCTLGYRAPLTAIDAATGKVIRTYDGTEGTDEIVHADGQLVVCIRDSLVNKAPTDASRNDRATVSVAAIDASSGKLLWQKESNAIVPLSLALDGPNVFYHDAGAVVSRDAKTGRQRWRTPVGGAMNSLWNTDMTLLVHDGVVLCAKKKHTFGLSVEDGRELWKMAGGRGFGICNPPDLFVADGLIWKGGGRAEPTSIVGFDPKTGKAARTVTVGPVITHGHHARCYRSKATDNYLLLPKRATEFIDIQGDKHSRHNWVRGACRYGMLPCNGLLYSSPHPCFCYAGVKLGGFMALSGESSKPSKRDAESHVERGPAAEDIPSSTLSADDWPMYRHDPKRSGSVATEIGTKLKSTWKVRLGGELTQPVVAGDKLFVARVDAGQIWCLHATNGKSIWNFIAGSRIDSSPTYHDGRLLFGSADGWVYCLRATDGELAWRFRAAPEDRRVVAFGQVESAWPVHGSVFMLDGVAYATAGRSSFLDGGIYLYGLDPATGRTVCETRIDGPSEDLNVRDEMAYSTEGSKSDILVTDGEKIYLFHNAFDKDLEKLPTPVKGPASVRNLGERDIGYRLFSNAGFLDTSGFNRNYWMLDDRWPAFNFAHQSPKAGQIVVFDDEDVFAAKCNVRRNMLSPQGFPGTDGHFLFADSHATRPVAVKSDGKGGPKFIPWLPQEGPLQTCWNLGVGFARAEPPTWVRALPVRIRAMVRTKNGLIVAGPPDVCEPQDPAASLEGRAGAILMAIDPANGETQFECNLDTPPVFDGISAAHGKLFVSLENGELECFGR